MAQASVSVAFYVYISAAWVELDTSHPYRAAWGIGDNNPTSRLADIGEFTLALNNSTGQYTVGGPSALAGWKKQLPFKMEITFEGTVQKRWRGYISDIQIKPNNKDKKAYITVVEWLDYASRHPIINPGIQTNKRGDEVLTTVISGVEIQPQTTDFDTGVETFPTAFDTVTSKTKAYTEFAKVALSEIGMVYEIHDLTHGETIRFENATARHGWIAPGNIPLTAADSGFALNEDGGFALNEDGGFALNNDVAAFTADGSVITDFEAPYGEHVINYMAVTPNPRRISLGLETQTIEIPLLEDFHLASEDPTTNFDSAVNIGVGEWNAGTAIRRTIIKPDFQTLPEGAVIHSAKLRLYPISPDQSSNARTMSAYRVLRTAINGSATWNTYNGVDNWGTAGCSNSTTDYDGAIELGNMAVPASPTLNTALEMEFSETGVEELQKMLDGTYANSQIVLFVNTQTDDLIYYASRENTNSILHPNLVLEISKNIYFHLDSEIIIGSGQTVTIKGNYVDPLSGLPINAQDMISPVETTDYTMFTATNGGGTDISSSLSVVPSYGTEGFTHEVTNNNANVGYINKFNCRGTGIYYHNKIEHVAENAASIAEFGTESETINQKYKINLYSGTVFAESVVDEHRQPRTVLNSISFCANRSPSCMMAFLYTEIGDMRYISIPEAGIAGNYYIQGIEFTMSGGIIMVKWIVVLALSLQVGLSPLAVEFAGGAATDGINFGFLPRVSNLTKKSFSIWIYNDSAPVTTSDNIIGVFSDENGQLISLTTDMKIQFYSKRTATLGIWKTPINSITAAAWHHVLVTHDVTIPTTDPIIYIDGVLQALTEDSTPAGALKTEDGTNFVIGNWKTSTADYTRSWDGKIFDPRIYSTILTAANATTLYNAGVPNVTLVTDGLVFQGFNVRTGDLASYIGTTLTSAYALRENMYGAIGVPHGSPVGRVSP